MGIDFQAFQQFGHGERLEVCVRCAERVRNGFVFLRQQAAGGIDQAPARPQQTRRTRQNRRLLLRDLINRFGILAPLQIRVAPQRAQARARRVHQHPVDLAGQALDTVITLMRNGCRVHIGQTTACQAWLERVQPMGRVVKCVQAPGVAHARTNGQGLAACPGTKIHHHLAALGVEQQGKELRAFVLHLDRPPGEHIQLAQIGLTFYPQAPGRIQARRGLDPGLGHFLFYLRALGRQGVDPQIQRRQALQAFHQGPELVAQLALELFRQPLRQVVAVALHQVFDLDAIAGVKPVFLLVRKRALEEVTRAHAVGKTQNRHAALLGAGA